ncbi:MAG: flagellar basal body L-ring protein FlgH [Bdellovibrionales bacterium]|nr:flagellar basal body L-ring protein FlgH [Bdellovibrionales bacterium]
MRTVMTFIAFMITLAFSGCSTLNPFSKPENENYNALTYGADYARRPDGQTGWSRNYGNAPVAPVSSSSGTIFRGTASAEPQQDKKTAFYGSEDAETGTEMLDPTDDNVRAQIENRRARQSGEVARNSDRAIRSDFYDNTPNDGSLWSNENDANYFFTKGKVRAMGDIISVKMEEPIIRQVAEEIKKSLTPAEQEVEMALYLKNADGAKGDKDIQAYRNVAAEELKTNEAEDIKNKMEKAVRWSQIDLSKTVGLTPNEELRAEVIDRYQNGNYKIRAVKRVMYRGSSKLMSIVAVAPASDFDEKDVINSGKLYEHKIKIAR